MRRGYKGCTNGWAWMPRVASSADWMTCVALKLRHHRDDHEQRCRNHHRILGDDQKDHPSIIGDPPSLHECAGHFLKGLADLFALLVAKLHEYGDELIAFAKREAAASTVGGDR